MKVKVCGLNDVANIKEVVQLQPDFIGFIFYGKSPRNCTMDGNCCQRSEVGND